MNVNVEYINPFLSAAQSVLRDVCQMEVKMQKPFIKGLVSADDTAVIIIGITGEIKGQVMITFTKAVGCTIASRMMMGMPVNELDDMAKSAISELGNMIMGNTATLLAKTGVCIDITPPTLCLGTMAISVTDIANICVPLTFDGGSIDINIALKKK